MLATVPVNSRQVIDCA